MIANVLQFFVRCVDLHRFNNLNLYLDLSAQPEQRQLELWKTGWRNVGEVHEVTNRRCGVHSDRVGIAFQLHGHEPKTS